MTENKVLGNKLHFTCLPAFSDFLLKYHLEEISLEQLKLMEQYEVPIFQLLKLTDRKVLEAQVKERMSKMLSFLADNKAREFLQSTVHDWNKNLLPLVSRENINVEDITLVSMIRRRIFRNLIPQHTSDIFLMKNIEAELDHLTATFDITLLKLILNQQQLLYEHTQKLAHVGNWIWNLNTGKKVWSEEYYRIYGLGPEASESDFTKLNHPEDQPEIDARIKNTLENHEPHDFFYRITSKDGLQKNVHARGKIELDENKKPVRLFSTLQDITTIMKAHEKLRQSEERYHSMVSEVQDYAIILLDNDGVIQNWNKGAEKIKGYAEDEVLGKRFSIFYTKEDLEKDLPKEMLDIARESGRATHEGWRVRKDNSKFWANTVITALYDKNREVFGFTKVTRDLTERKIAEDKLRAFTNDITLKNKKLEQLNKELESFNYIASHDLQEPLRKIQAFSQRLLDKEVVNLSDWGKDVFTKIQNAAERMQKLIDALLNFSRLGTNNTEGMSAVNLQLVFEDIKNTLQTRIEATNAIIDVEQLPAIFGIPFHISQLFTNLIGNALKYIKPGVQPKIKVRSSVVKGKNIAEFSAPAEKEYHHITIEDNGIGFEQQYEAKIFELFQRLHGKAEFEGTGIGLSICKKIVDNHFGHICAEGNPGKGSIFHVFLPVMTESGK